MTPVALSKAEALASYAKHCGVKQDEFVLALTVGEAYELLDHLATGAMGLPKNMNALRQDIADAKVAGDPFAVLADWRLLGFEIRRVLDLH